MIQVVACYIWELFKKAGRYLRFAQNLGTEGKPLS